MLQQKKANSKAKQMSEVSYRREDLKVQQD